MNTKEVDPIYDYIQERCLWQFHSRFWDREENIAGVIQAIGDILTNTPVETNTPQLKSYHADARILVVELKRRFPWLLTIPAAELRSILSALKDRLIDTVVTRSLNGELRQANY